MRLPAIVAVALAAILTLPAPARAQVSAEAAGQMIAETYGVEILRVREGEVDGRPAWLVTVMVPGGDTNAAFMVNTLAVDRESGELLPSFRHKPSGYRLPPGGLADDRDARNPARARSGVWR